MSMGVCQNSAQPTTVADAGCSLRNVIPLMHVGDINDLEIDSSNGIQRMLAFQLLL